MPVRAALVLLAALCMDACAVPPDPDEPTADESHPVELVTPEPGVSRKLAATRKKDLTEVRYELEFRLAKGMPTVSGRCIIRFDLAKARPVVLDFDGESLADVELNGAPATPNRLANHLVFRDARKGSNTIAAAFTSRVAPTGTPLTVYRDKTDGAEYYYTLFVPADAHRLFPCFDQPDLKARFTLRIRAPEDWKVVANGTETGSNRTARTFEPTEPLPTYLFAFAAGPFVELPGPTISRTNQTAVQLRAFARRSKLDRMEKRLLFAMHRDAAEWLGDYFACPYPFSKLDMVLLPGFPYGGMEHAGAIFYRESSLVFEQKPTEGELTRRSTLIYHEVSHQWFGNLVTMEWFDDLWLKEGFATFMGYTLFETLEPGKHAWLRFHHRVKPRAYAVDATSGTTPVYQELTNLANAKSAYGAIVYNKAPAIIRELNHRLGPATFQKGLQLFLVRHRFGNATWRDLIAALEQASKQSAAPWSNRWILAAGMPRVRARWSSTDDKITAFSIQQQSIQGDSETWPLQLDVLLIDAGGSHHRTKVVADGAETSVAELIGRVRPSCVLLNPGDIAYGQFLLDDISQRWLVEQAREIRNPLVRAVAMSALYDTVREAGLDPAGYAATALDLLAIEKDAGTHAWLLATIRTCLLRYMPSSKSIKPRARLGEILRTQLTGPVEAVKTQALRALMSTCTDAESLECCVKVAAGQSPFPGVEVGRRDRFMAAAALLGAGRGRAALDAVVADLGKEDVDREKYVAGAADPKTKAEYFASYANLDEPPEQWMSLSLGNFHWPGHQAAALPYLRQALDKVEWVKKNRKIFFMPAWIDAFVNGHSSTAALAQVEAFLDERRDLPIDIRRKILQSLDSLQRAVRIKRRWN